MEENGGRMQGSVNGGRGRGGGGWGAVGPLMIVIESTSAVYTLSNRLWPYIMRLPAMNYRVWRLVLTKKKKRKMCCFGKNSFLISTISQL